MNFQNLLRTLYTDEENNLANFGRGDVSSNVRNLRDLQRIFALPREREKKGGGGERETRVFVRNIVRRVISLTAYYLAYCDIIGAQRTRRAGSFDLRGLNFGRLARHYTDAIFRFKERDENDITIPSRAAENAKIL